MDRADMDENYTYIVRCADGTLYTGWTNDLKKRIKAHNAGKGAKYTKTRRPVELVYFEHFATKEEAMSREYHIKQLKRAQKQALIDEMNKNYTRIFVVNGTVDTTFIHSIWYTALFTVVSVLIINIVSFAIAMALTKGIRGTNLFRTVFFLPNLIGGIVLSYVWLMIFNSILQNYSKTIVSSEWSAFWGLIAVVCWQQIGYMMIIYIAGIQNIPGELIEAAKIDGANRWQLLKSVILPMLMPTITICTFLTLTNGFKLFDQNLALTGGNPGKMSELLALNIYNTMYGTTGWQGVGQAKAVIFFIIVAIIALAQNKITTSKEVQD
jgi:permease of ABC transporter possibly for oligosaccharides